MIHSDNCTNLVASFEGCKLTAYQDQRGIWTIGFGHTGDVNKGDTITADHAHVLLSNDLKIADKAVAAAVSVVVNQNEWDAMVSLAFNIGGSAFLHSTLVRLLNSQDFDGAGNQFLIWNKTNGFANPGLTRRRVAERKLFVTPVEAQ